MCNMVCNAVNTAAELTITGLLHAKRSRAQLEVSKRQVGNVLFL